MKHKLAIIGASGYTGAELIRLIETHPKMEITALVGNTRAGSSMSDIFSHLSHMELPNLTKLEETDFERIDLCFCALPHKTSQQVIGQLPESLKVIDLSADFRLRDVNDYEKWYKEKHVETELQKKAIYGLTEFYRERIKGANLVAGTGCNAALGQYMLRPLISSNVIDLENIILDMKCAVSGAGRAMREDLLHSEASEGIRAYAVGGIHRHLGEFDQEFSLLAGQPVQIQFTPHLIPANRSGKIPVNLTLTLSLPSVTLNEMVSPTPRSKLPSSTSPPILNTSFGLGVFSTTWVGLLKKLIPSFIAKPIKIVAVANATNAMLMI